MLSKVLTHQYTNYNGNKTMKAVKLLPVLCFAIVLSVLSAQIVSAQIKPNQTKVVQTSANQNDSPDMDNLAADQDVGKNRNNERYRIGFQDTLEVTVTKHPELSQVVSVNSDGTINMPRIDMPIVAVCKTERELKQTIENLYKSFLRTPYVNVRSVDQKSQPFAVIGAVVKPGSFYLSQKIQLLGLISLAGGPDVEKSGSKVRIARVGNYSACDEKTDSIADDKKVEFITYNLKDVQDGKQNPWMQPGDVVSVLQADEAYVVGNVVKPSTISLQEPKTLTQAIAKASGTDSTARTDKVIIQRQNPGDINKTELVFNLKDIISKKIPDPQLQANDIVVVSNDNVKSVRNGFLKAITGGIGNIFLRLPAPKSQIVMRDSREILHKQVETVEIERPFETQMPTANGGYGAFRDAQMQQGFQLVTYWRIIRKRFWLVIGIAVLLTTAAAIYMARKPDVFQAAARVQVDSEQVNQDLVTNDRRLPVNNQDAAYFNTQLQLLTSESLLRRVVKDFSLDTNPEFLKAKKESSVSPLRAILKAAGLAGGTTKKSDDGVDEIAVSPSSSVATSEEIAEAVRLAPFVDIIKKNLGVEPIRESRGTTKETRLIEITFRNTDPDLAALIVNGVSEVFAKVNQEKRTGTNKETNEFLEKRIADLQTDIKNSENKLVQQTKGEGILKTGENDTIVLNRLSGLNKQLLDAENERKNAQAEYDSVNNSKDRLQSLADAEILRYTTDRDAAIQALINKTQEKITDLNARKVQLLEEYLENAPEVKEVDKQIALVEKRFNRSNSRE